MENGKDNAPIEAPHTPVVDEETAQKLGEQALSRIDTIARMVKQHYRAIHGDLNSIEMYQLGMDAILAGFQLISRSNDMDELDVDMRISCMNATLNVIINVLNKVYLDPNVVAGYVAQAALHNSKGKKVSL